MKHQRFVYIDHLRVLLTVLVILHHVSVAYGGMGGWGFIDPNLDETTSIFLTLFNAVNQSFFMAAFFFLAAYFTS